MAILFVLLQLCGIYLIDFYGIADTFLGFEEIDGEEEFREEFACPFCSDYFDIVSLCCHIDEGHSMEAKNGVIFFLSLKHQFISTF